MEIKKTSQAAAMIFKKIAIHGKSGLGKTLLAATAAPYKPIIILTERTGVESLQPELIRKIFGADREDILYDIDYIEAYSSDEFMQALDIVRESEDYNLVIFDSFSKASRWILKEAKGNYADGRKAYGEHNDVALNLVEELMQLDKHCVFICHSKRTDDGENGAEYAPGFEGAGFIEKFIYDLAHILCLVVEYDDDGKAIRKLRCHQEDSDKFAKNRGGRLAPLEEPHLGRLIRKLSAPKKKKAKPSTAE